MATHVIVGAGPIGSATARLLADDGHEVRVVTRRGAGPAHERIQRISADATDVGRLADLCAGATVLYNCANPPYHRWRTDWPPLAEATAPSGREVRRGSGDDEQPVRVRRGEWSDA